MLRKAISRIVKATVRQPLRPILARSIKAREESFLGFMNTVQLEQRLFYSAMHCDVQRSATTMKDNGVRRDPGDWQHSSIRQRV
jgi:hypothetical protein